LICHDNFALFVKPCSRFDTSVLGFIFCMAAVASRGAVAIRGPSSPSFSREGQRGACQQTRRFPPPWTFEEQDTYFVVRDRDGQQLAYVYFDDPRAGG
jgi:hypothetical protein